MNYNFVNNATGERGLVCQYHVVCFDEVSGIGADPLPPGQVWSISPGTLDEHPGLYRVEVNVGPGSGSRSSTGPNRPRSSRAPATVGE